MTDPNSSAPLTSSITPAAAALATILRDHPQGFDETFLTFLKPPIEVRLHFSTSDGFDASMEIVDDRDVVAALRSLKENAK